MEAQTAAMPDLDRQPPGTVVATEMDLQAGEAGYGAMEGAAMARMAPDPKDASLMVEFFSHRGKDYLKVLIPGDKLNQPVFEATDYYKARFAAQWRAYQTRQSQHEGQIMLSECAWIDEGMRDHLAGFGIKTVEGLAGVSDGNLDPLGPGFRALRARAQAVIDDKARIAEVATQRSFRDEIRQEMASLRADFDAKLRAKEDENTALRAEIAALRENQEDETDTTTVLPDGVMVKANGEPYKTRPAAAMAAQNRKLDADPVEVEGGWGLLPRAGA